MSFMSSFKENNVHLWIRASKPLTGDVRNNWVSSWGISVLTSTAWGFATLTRTTHQNSVAVPGLTCQTTAHNSAPNWEQGPVRWSCDGWSWCRVVCVCVCVRKTCCVWSTSSTASEARGSCCSLAGYESDNTIVSVCCPPAHPVCPAPPMPWPLHNRSAGNPHLFNATYVSALT